MRRTVISRAAYSNIRSLGDENRQAVIMRHKPRHAPQFENHARRANNAENQQRLEAPLHLTPNLISSYQKATWY
jgi:hypothetical protein